VAFYDYRCRDCGHEWEERASMNDPPKRICPKCGRPKAERLISRTSFALRGKGWAKDGYGNPPPKKGKGS
jgi:putative FmdB family regulatory protein